MRDTLAGMPLFEGLSDLPLDQLEVFAELRQLAAGDVLFTERDPGEEVFVVVEGFVEILKTVAVGQARTLARLGPGSMFGEAAIIDHEQRSATARAETACSLLRLPADPLREWLIANPSVGVMVLGRLGSMMMDRLRATNELYREAVAWGQAATGASRYGLDRFVGEERVVEVHLVTGRDLLGRLLQVSEGPAGLELVVSDGRDAHVVPYRAVAALRLVVDDQVGG